MRSLYEFSHAVDWDAVQMALCATSVIGVFLYTFFFGYKGPEHWGK